MYRMSETQDLFGKLNSLPVLPLEHARRPKGRGVGPTLPIWLTTQSPPISGGPSRLENV